MKKPEGRLTATFGFHFYYFIRLFCNSYLSGGVITCYLDNCFGSRYLCYLCKCFGADDLCPLIRGSALDKRYLDMIGDSAAYLLTGILNVSDDLSCHTLGAKLLGHGKIKRCRSGSQRRVPRLRYR